MKLDEIFDTKLDLSWQLHGRHELTSFTVEDKTFVIQIERRPLSEVPETNGLKTAEVSFYRHDLDNDDAFNTTKESPKMTSAIYGIMTNAVAVKFESYDVFYFSAERKHSSNQEEYETKVRIYDALSRRVKGRYKNVFRYEAEVQDKMQFIVSKQELKDDTVFKDMMKEALLLYTQQHTILEISKKQDI